MANRIIKLGRTDSSQLSAEQLLVYADLNLNASPAKIHLKAVLDDNDMSGSSHSWLSSDPGEQDSDTGYIMQDDQMTVPGGHLKLQTAEQHMNLWKAAYNEAQRKKAHYQLEKNINIIAIKHAIRNIFTWTPGERILNPEFGSRLRSYLYEGITAYNQEQIMAEIRRCFSEWEPRAVLDKVVNLTDVDDKEDNTVRMEIIYSVPSLNAYQMSYIYEFQRSA